MTEQRDLQDKLAALGTSDGLTGIANRRHFDERPRNGRGPSATARLSRCCRWTSITSRSSTINTAIRPATHASARWRGSWRPKSAGRPFALMLQSTDAGGCEPVGEKRAPSVSRPRHAARAESAVTGCLRTLHLNQAPSSHRGFTTREIAPHLEGACNDRSGTPAPSKAFRAASNVSCSFESGRSNHEPGAYVAMRFAKNDCGSQSCPSHFSKMTIPSRVK